MDPEYTPVLEESGYLLLAKRPARERATIDLRCVPTPGSTTETNTVPAGQGRPTAAHNSIDAKLISRQVFPTAQEESK